MSVVRFSCGCSKFYLVATRQCVRGLSLS